MQIAVRSVNKALRAPVQVRYSSTQTLEADKVLSQRKRNPQWWLRQARVNPSLVAPPLPNPNQIKSLPDGEEGGSSANESDNVESTQPGSLLFRVKESALQGFTDSIRIFEFMSSHGKVCEFKMRRELVTGRYTGSGVVTFMDGQDAQRLVDMERVLIPGISDSLYLRRHGFSSQFNDVPQAAMFDPPFTGFGPAKN
ncbi:hypothetical protein GQ42DRAFT_20361 [Ramicandelaber brevisporus]|nr:hypothetical protein GQ42DRAFT_20361 [Ramicandelaber brevisporus]